MAGLTPMLRGDEGMWLYNNLPVDHLQKKYGFEVKKDWLEQPLSSRQKRRGSFPKKQRKDSSIDIVVN